MEAAGLTDLFPHCHPDKTYNTWNNHNTWSSPDYILFSSHAAHDIIASRTSDINVQLMGADHKSLSSYINVDAPVDIPRENRDKCTFDIKRKAEFATNLDDALANIPDQPSAETFHEAFSNTCIQVGKAMFQSPRTTLPY
jgi:hypothetical protein